MCEFTNTPSFRTVDSLVGKLKALFSETEQGGYAFARLWQPSFLTSSTLLREDGSRGAIKCIIIIG